MPSSFLHTSPSFSSTWARTTRARMYYMTDFLLYPLISPGILCILSFISFLITYLYSTFVIRTSENVQVRVDLRISFQIYEPEAYVIKPIDFHSQIRYWVQNEMLDAYAKFTFREFLKTYAGIVFLISLSLFLVITKDIFCRYFH